MIIYRRLSLQKLHEEIENHRQPMDNFMDISNDLRQLVSPDDADELSHKCEEVATRYDRLGATSLALGKVLEEMVEGIGNFLLKMEDLKIWLDDMELQLKKFDTISVFMDVLTQQCADLMVRFFRFPKLLPFGIKKNICVFRI